MQLASLRAAPGEAIQWMAWHKERGANANSYGPAISRIGAGLSLAVHLPRPTSRAKPAQTSAKHRMFENAFNNIDKVMRNDEGLASELDYAEQTSWLLFLKYLDDLEAEREDRAALEGGKYSPILDTRHRWRTWPRRRRTVRSTITPHAAAKI